jgi:hypothetical protein
LCHLVWVPAGLAAIPRYGWAEWTTPYGGDQKGIKLAEELGSWGD